MMDYKCEKLKSLLWYADIEGSFEAEEDGELEIGLGVYGTAKLFVNDKLLIDNETVQRKGEMFFNCGTVEEKGYLTMKKGETYHVKVEFASAPSCKLDQGTSVLFGGGALRIGGAKVIDADEEVKHAARLAKEADQVIICAGLNVRPPLLLPFIIPPLIPKFTRCRTVLTNTSTGRLGIRRHRPRKYGPPGAHGCPHQRRQHGQPLHSRNNAIRDPSLHALAPNSQRPRASLVRWQ